MAVFQTIGIVIGLAAVIAIAMRILRQPLIIGYILTGIITGPYALHMISSEDTLHTFSQLGIALLLFIVGLGLNPKVIKELGKVSVIIGFGQVLFSSIIGIILAKVLGFSSIEAIYISIAMSFSSTIIIMKLLSDKGDLETLYGRIATGVLIVQDLIAILILMSISSSPEGHDPVLLIYGTILKLFMILVLLFITGIYVLPPLTKFIAKSQELLLLFSIGWCLALAALFNYYGMTMEIGALIAGMTLSLSPYRFEISSKMRPLRDFFLVLFFITLGAQIGISDLIHYLVPVIIFSLFVLLGHPLIVFILMGFLGYTKRNFFFTGSAMAQISEFSLILVSLGVQTGYISHGILSFVTMVGFITIAGSSYLILYTNRLYCKLRNFLNIFERSGEKIDEQKYHGRLEHDIILFGYNRIGLYLVEAFKKIKKRFLVIDFNPETIKTLSHTGIDCRYGDAGDAELLEELNFTKTRLIVSTIPDFDTNALLINRARKQNKNIIIIVLSHQIDEAIELYNKGATYVIMPHFLGGFHASTLIKEYGFDAEKFVEKKIEHVEHLKAKKSLGHEHPRIDD